jgi:hypothetical protein
MVSGHCSASTSAAAPATAARAPRAGGGAAAAARPAAPGSARRRASGARGRGREPSRLAAAPVELLALAALDEAPAWTLDQAAGLAFSGLLVALYLSATQVDAWVARAQRRELGLCEECGGLYDAATCAEARCPSRAAKR